MNHRVSSVDSSPTVPSLEQQACGRPLPAFRMHVWTIELTQSLLCDPEPLMLPPLAAIYLPSCGFHMTILRKVEPPLQWPVVPVGPGYHDKYVGDPWYRFLAEGDFVHGDEVGSGYQETHLYSRCHRTHDATELPFGNDIIGVVDEVVFRHISPRSKRVVFKLMNLSNQLLSCTLWDDYYLQFLEYLDQHETERPIIVMLTNARIKEGQAFA
ncbi:hypothetical protein JHK86_035188 [Glycine max]|nr:hypothetical protein JHK86_035188 [Glycine max]